MVIWLNHSDYHVSMLLRFCGISAISEFGFGEVLKTKTQKSSKIFIFGFIKLKYIWICFLITFLFFEWWNWNKQKLTEFTNIEGSKAIAREIPAIWLVEWLNHFEFDVIWAALQLFWSYILIARYHAIFAEFRWFLRLCFWIVFVFCSSFHSSSSRPEPESLFS